MKVLVTGGSGKLGRWVLRELVEHGHDVVNADRRQLTVEQSNEDWSTGVRYCEVDLGNLGQISGALSGCDALVHLGAIPAPVNYPPEVVFGTNSLSTFNVLQAAEYMGVRKAVLASSLAVLGITYAPRVFPPLYAPVDEEHPLLGQDTYALSKEVDELTGAMFHRRTGMDVLAYRFHWVTDPAQSSALADEVRSDPAAMSHLFWGYVDVRDVAQACRLGAESEGLGYQVFNITAADTLSDEPTEEMLAQYCPGVQVRVPIPGVDSAFSSAKAERLLGYVPRFSWRESRQAEETE